MTRPASPFEAWWGERMVADAAARTDLAVVLRDWLVWCGRTGAMPGLPSLFLQRVMERAGDLLRDHTTHVAGFRLRREDDV